MSQYAKLTDSIGDRLIELLEGVRDQHIQAISNVREAAERFVPELPEQISERLPKPEDIAKANFSLAERLLKAQKAYALGVIDAFEAKQKAAPRRKSTAKASAEKASTTGTAGTAGTAGTEKVAS